MNLVPPAILSRSYMAHFAHHTDTLPNWDSLDPNRCPERGCVGRQARHELESRHALLLDVTACANSCGVGEDSRRVLWLSFLKLERG
ncbi:hypothetical protein MUK42_30223 [Musa troglodytarum]|uniref:Uncharacterized protein n=1 Tax=Musa troglodytarum TaxID=320322 RepID=A0A9E7FTV7_9LILI|nr:hypothetical protein MUK42_30223 [Musa troglodytarum]